jgi:hypothetical protein
MGLSCRTLQHSRLNLDTIKRSTDEVTRELVSQPNSPHPNHGLIKVPRSPVTAQLHAHFFLPDIRTNLIKPILNPSAMRGITKAPLIVVHPALSSPWSPAPERAV